MWGCISECVSDGELMYGCGDLLGSLSLLQFRDIFLQIFSLVRCKYISSPVLQSLCASTFDFSLRVEHVFVPLTSSVNCQAHTEIFNYLAQNLLSDRYALDLKKKHKQNKTKSSSTGKNVMGVSGCEAYPDLFDSRGS